MTRNILRVISDGIILKLQLETKKTLFDKLFNRDVKQEYIVYNTYTDELYIEIDGTRMDNTGGITKQAFLITMKNIQDAIK